MRHTSPTLPAELARRSLWAAVGLLARRTRAGGAPVSSACPVSYTDLDLRTAAGREELSRRVALAADDLRRGWRAGPPAGRIR